MKHTTILALIFLLLLLFVMQLPSKAQFQKQVKITQIIKQKKGKLIIKGKDMQGQEVTIGYGYHAGLFRQRYSSLKTGIWITLHCLDDKGRCRVSINQ